MRGVRDGEQEKEPGLSAHDVPALVRGIRAARNITQEQLAHEVGVTFSTINAWENGRHQPIPALVKRLLAIASAAGVAVNPGRRMKAPRSRRPGRSPGK